MNPKCAQLAVRIEADVSALTMEQAFRIVDLSQGLRRNIVELDDYRIIFEFNKGTLRCDSNRDLLHIVQHRRPFQRQNRDRIQ